MSEPHLPQTPELGLIEELTLFKNWVLSNRVPALLMFTVLATFAGFFGLAKIFVNGELTTAQWAAAAWVGDQGHSWMVPPISLFLLWYHREAFRNAPKAGSNRGLFYFLIGIVLFVLSARCLQPRMALCSVPFLVYGAVYYVWGAKVARIALFPCGFLIFMIPFAVLEQATFRLQFVITGLVEFLTNLLGIKINALGTTLTAADGSFNFEIAEGCSGIRSLTAMTMLTAIYAHLTQDRVWKMALVLCGSAIFAIIGNAGRIFTVVLVARFYDPVFAAGTFHDYSGYISFPFALGAMIGFSKLVNLDFRKAVPPETPPPSKAGDTTDSAKEEKVKTYDY
jgi:exosortase